MAEQAPVPARITMALDAGGHEGPEVDLAVGTWERNPAGDVDMWEAGLEVPTAEQVGLLAALTGHPVAFFYEPIPAGPLNSGMWICFRRKVNGRRCHAPAPDWVDGRGVLHYGDQPARTPPAQVQGALF